MQDKNMDGWDFFNVYKFIEKVLRKYSDSTACSTVGNDSQ